MKNLITTIGSILVLTIFLMQFVANENTLIKLISVESAIKSFRINKEFSQENVYELKEEISRRVGCNQSQVIVDYDKDGHYNIKTPISGVIGAAKICGISDAENMFIYESQGVMLLYEESDSDHWVDNFDGNIKSYADYGS